MNNLPFLAILGVSAADSARLPTIEAMPVRFNKGNGAAWSTACESVAKVTDFNKAWGLAIRRYVKICLKENLFVMNTNSSSNNDEIYNILASSRKNAVRYLNKIQLLKKVRIRKTERHVIMTNSGFNIRIVAKVDILDPTIEEWLIQLPYPGFKFIKVNRELVKPIDSYTTVFVGNSGTRSSQRYYVGYSINVNKFPVIEYIPSKDELQQFILNTLWMPLLNSHRPDNSSVKLI